MVRSTVVAIAGAVALTITACTASASDEDAANGSGTRADTAGPSVTATEVSPGDPFAIDTVAGSAPGQFVGLQTVGSCDALLDHFVDNALELVTPWGLGHAGGPLRAEGDGGVDFATEAAAAESGADDMAGDGSVEFSTTNVQEDGVDEPDTVKTDGEVIVTSVDGRIEIVDVKSAEVVGTIALDDDVWNAQLLLAGDDLLVLSTVGSVWGGPVTTELTPAFPAERTTVTRYDLSDPSAPTEVGRITIEGTSKSARMVDGTVRLVISSHPTGLSFTFPTDSGLSSEQDALDGNRRLLRESDLDDWVPHYRVTAPDGAQGDVTQLLDCGQVARPQDFSGFETLSVVTMAIDDDQMEPASAAGIVASGETVYASTDRLIVATSPWGGWIEPFITDDTDRDAEVTTQLHAFDISDPTSTSYVGSGQVEGRLINQFAISEVDGVVRVATTTGNSWWGSSGDSQSSLVILTEQDATLVETGRVDGLGVTEQIHSVRYLSPDVAAIVTFRQTDPLYLVDTSEPTAPTVAGELKIPGVSTYLHPIADGWLLGVGQDATDDGRTTGLQVSLFDVSDLSDPRRVDNLTWEGGYSNAEYDHHAFTYWAETGQVVLPLEIHDMSEQGWQPQDIGPDGEPDPTPGPPFIGAVVVQVEPGRLTEQGRLTQNGTDGRTWDGADSIQRSLVIGDDLWTLGWNSLARHDLESLDFEQRVALR